MMKNTDEIYQWMVGLLQKALWKKGTTDTADWALYEEMKKQAIIALPAGIFSSLRIPDDLRQVWQTEIYQQITFNVNYRKAQAALPVTVPYVILKGTSAAKYYPQPLYRSMGDIDIMTRREDYDAACDMLLEAGYKDCTSDMELASGRHRQFSGENIMIEVHACYAHQNDPEKARLLDNLIIQNINPSHELPDEINGLVLIDHINHHMESGLGLRQIIDWMLYVNQCLPDEKWPEFRKQVQAIGLEKLSIVTTRMSEMYLGLPEHQWCASADPAVCEQYMDYLIGCGNFGRNQEEDSRVSQRFLSSTRTLRGTIQFLQGRGLITWRASQKYAFLRPFAWIYQAFRYLRKGLQRENTVQRVREEYEAGQKRNELFDALEISREEKGLASFENGEYIIK